METRIFHGKITPDDLGRALVGEFDRGNLRVQQIGKGKQVVVQIATRFQAQSGGQTALSIHIHQVEDGVAVQAGRQNWLGVAASLGQTAFATWRNPFNLLDRLDDLAQDIESLQLSEQVWQVIEKTAQAVGATHELSERLRRMVCLYCQSANPVGESNCVACGAPLGAIQPRTCSRCGFVLKHQEQICPNCKQRL